MLVIREEQMKVLGRDSHAAFEAQLCDVFLRNYPRECRQAGGTALIRRWVQLGLRTAAAAGYRSQHQAGRWQLLMLILGVDFTIDPQLPWVRECLDPVAESDATARIDRLFEQTLDYLSITAGENAEFVVRAMLRMRAIDFASIPALEGAAAVEAATERLRALYPQKFDFQGPALTATTVAAQFLRARELGLSGPSGEFLYALLSFMLGNGFDHDPLHGWASEILQPAASGDGGDRAARLEAAAREHLALSLSTG